MKIPTFLCSLLLSVSAQAHYLWIESESPGDARVYFGEFNEGVLEKSGGRLDERDATKAWLLSEKHGKKPLALEKLADRFVSETSASSGWLLVRDSENPVMDWRVHDIGLVKPMYYARAAVANKPLPSEPTLALDVLPVAGSPLTYQVFFQGEPLAGAKGHTYAPNLWMQEFKTDEEGKFTIATPWTGRYVLDVIHKEPAPGEFKGEAYDAIRHRTTYSFVR